MKKILKFLPAVIAAVAIVVATSLSWLAIENPIDFPTSFSGSTRVSYFAGGDGSKDDPYIIATPTHVYNLAWLQYLGYFNLGGYINNGRAQSFFKVADNIDMQGLVIPPIGTREYPFIGNFNGNNKVIYNFIVSNTKSGKSTNGKYNLTKYPRRAEFEDGGVLLTTDTVSKDSSTQSQVNIVGMFGVTGDLTLDNTGATFVTKYYADKGLTINDYADDEKTKLVDLPADGTNTAANELYYSGMKISGFYIDKVIVNTESEKSLVGILAGYIGSTVENTGVYRSKISVKPDTTGGLTDLLNSKKETQKYDTVVSKYSLVGDYDSNVVGWTENPSSSGKDKSDTWGGSIDMKMVNRRVGYMYNNGAEGYNLKMSISTSLSEYYWKTTSQTNAYLKSGTIIPLSVDEEKMFLAGESGAVVDENNQAVLDENGNAVYYELTNSNKHTNSYYLYNDSEIVDRSKNSGYIVGGENDSRLGIHALRNLSNSLGESSPASYNGDNLTLLTTNADGSTIYKITPIGAKVSSAVNALTNTKASSDFKHLNSVTNTNGVTFKGVLEKFDDSLNGKTMIHGFHFFNGITATSYTKTEGKNVWINGENFGTYEFIEGALNFSIKTQGEIRVIAGTYTNSQMKHALFDLYKVNRTGGIISSIEKINKISVDGDTILYNDTTGTGTEVINFAAINKPIGSQGRLLPKAAYYYEIPVVPGDYILGAAPSTGNSDALTSNYTAYLMYLDIGANGDEGGGGSGETKTLPYIMQSVDFVSMSDADTTFSVPSSGYPKYQDVGFELSGSKIDDEVFFKRAKYTADVTGDIDTIVYFWREKTLIDYALVPSDTSIGKESQTEATW